METLSFRDLLQQAQPPNVFDVVCQLQHFAIISYALEPQRLAGLLPPRFQLDLVQIDGAPRALLSVVPFFDADFRLVGMPFVRFQMGQTNYRIYVIDQETGKRCVWFLGTTLDSWSIVVPRFFWKLPWHPGRVSFSCQYDQQAGIYQHYQMQTEAEWAPVMVQLSQSPDQRLELPGFPDLETGLVVISHPLDGFYYRRDGRLGSYKVWHRRLNLKSAKLIEANFGLLTRLGLVSLEEQQRPHSVLIDPLTEFIIYLPPKSL